MPLHLLFFSNPRALQGIGIFDVLEAVVHRIPAPKNNMDKPLRALIFDSYYDPYRGVVCQFRVTDGAVGGATACVAVWLLVLDYDRVVCQFRVMDSAVRACYSTIV